VISFLHASIKPSKKVKQLVVDGVVNKSWMIDWVSSLVWLGNI